MSGLEVEPVHKIVERGGVLLDQSGHCVGYWFMQRMVGWQGCEV